MKLLAKTLSCPLLFAGLSLPAFADAPVSPQLQAFRTAQAALNAKIDAFLQDVTACNPPVAMVKNQILSGFGGTQDDSAKSMLALELKNVNDHVDAADLSLKPLEAAAAACKGDRNQLASQATQAGASIQTNLVSDLENLQSGADEAAKKKPLILTGLNMRQTAMDRHLPMLAAGDVAACKSAADKVTDLEAANTALAQSLQALKDAYSARVAKLSSLSPVACGGASPALFHNVSFSPGGDAPEAPALPPAGEAADDAVAI